MLAMESQNHAAESNEEVAIAKPEPYAAKLAHG